MKDFTLYYLVFACHRKWVIACFANWYFGARYLYLLIKNMGLCHDGVWIIKTVYNMFHQSGLSGLARLFPLFCVFLLMPGIPLYANTILIDCDLLLYCISYSIIMYSKKGEEGFNSCWFLISNAHPLHFTLTSPSFHGPWWPLVALLNPAPSLSFLQRCPHLPSSPPPWEGIWGFQPGKFSTISITEIERSVSH